MADNYGDPLNRLIFSDDEMIGFQDSAGEMFAAGDLTDESQKMLCFGDYENKCDLTLPLQSQISEITCNNNNSSATSCANNGKIKKKRSGYEGDGEDLSSGAGAPAGKRRGGKKNKGESSSGNVHARVKKGKEKLGDRITALQQLVSPFGKTDTASVLHEAMGYIKFLHEQVQVLCSPYLQTPLSSSQAQLHECGNPRENEQGEDLRSKGLCLVPVEWTLHVANSNGADLWSPAAAMKNNSVSNKY